MQSKDLIPDQIVGKYFISMNEPLGKGKLGEVYKGWLKDDPYEMYAIKIIDKHFFLEEGHFDSKDKFSIKDIILQKNSIMTELDHDNLVKVIEILFSTNNIYIVSQFCDGCSLQQMLHESQNNRISQDQSIAIIRKLVNALIYLRSHKISHFYLKPGAILLNSDCPKICSLQFSTQLIDNELISKKRLQDSPQWFSPQILQGSKYSEKADIWSLGVILYQMIYGKVPFQEKNPTKLLNIIKSRIINQQGKVLLQFPTQPYVDKQVKDLISKMIVYHENERIDYSQLAKHTVISEIASKSGSIEKNDNLIIESIIRTHISSTSDGLIFNRNSVYAQMKQSRINDPAQEKQFQVQEQDEKDVQLRETQQDILQNMRKNNSAINSMNSAVLYFRNRANVSLLVLNQFNESHQKFDVPVYIKNSLAFSIIFYYFWGLKTTLQTILIENSVLNDKYPEEWQIYFRSEQRMLTYEETNQKYLEFRATLIQFGKKLLEDLGEIKLIGKYMAPDEMQFLHQLETLLQRIIHQEPQLNQFKLSMIREEFLQKLLSIFFSNCFLFDRPIEEVRFIVALIIISDIDSFIEKNENFQFDYNQFFEQFLYNKPQTDMESIIRKFLAENQIQELKPQDDKSEFIVISDKYRIYPNQLLGFSDTWKVYQASFNTQDSIQLAVKAIQTQHFISNEEESDLSKQQQQQTKTRIISQIGVISQISHYNIVKFIGYELLDNYLYIFMEFCDGGNLRDRLDIAEQKRFSEFESLRIMKGLLSGIVEIHQSQVIHRNIQPENILFQMNTPQIGDYGDAQFIENIESNLQNSPSYKHQYSSPQVIFQTQYSAKTDIWSLGIILYEMIIGKHPFNIMVNLDCIREYKKYEQEQLISFPSDINISGSVKQLIQQMLAYSEEERIGFDELLIHPAIIHDYNQLILKTPTIERQISYESICFLFENGVPQNIKRKTQLSIEQISIQEISRIILAQRNQANFSDLVQSLILNVDKLFQQTENLVDIIVFTLSFYSISRLQKTIQYFNQEQSELHILYPEQMEVFEQSQEKQNLFQQTSELYIFKKQLITEENKLQEQLTHKIRSNPLTQDSKVNTLLMEEFYQISNLVKINQVATNNQLNQLLILEIKLFFSKLKFQDVQSNIKILRTFVSLLLLIDIDNQQQENKQFQFDFKVFCKTQIFTQDKQVLLSNLEILLKQFQITFLDFPA